MRRAARPLYRSVRFLARAGWRFAMNDGAAMAGYMAYTALLAVFPFLIFATALAGQIIGEERSAEAMEAMFSVMPSHVAQTLEPAVKGVLRRHDGSLLTISAVASIWVASNGVEAIRTAFERAYEVERVRNYVLRRTIAVLMVFVGVAVFAALGFLIVLAPLLMGIGERVSGVPMPFSVDVTRYIFGFALIWGFLWLLHRVLPARPTGSYRLWPGVLISVIVWMAIATGFSVYLAYAPSYTVTYGTLAGVIITLLFLYLTGVALIYGAEVNALVNAEETARIKAERRAAQMAGIDAGAEEEGR